MKIFVFLIIFVDDLQLQSAYHIAYSKLLQLLRLSFGPYCYNNVVTCILKTIFCFPNYTVSSRVYSLEENVSYHRLSNNGLSQTLVSLHFIINVFENTTNH